MKRPFNAGRLTKPENDDGIANCTQRYGQPVGQARSYVLPGQTVKIPFERAERTYGRRLIVHVEILDVHVPSVMAEDEYGDGEQDSNAQA